MCRHAGLHRPAVRAEEMGNAGFYWNTGMLQRVLKRAGLERIRFHDRRHTFSVLALQNGVDVKTLSAMLGHYSAGFTLGTYAHVTTSMQKRAANAVGNFLSGDLRSALPYGSRLGSDGHRKRKPT